MKGRDWALAVLLAVVATNLATRGSPPLRRVDVQGPYASELLAREAKIRELCTTAEVLLDGHRLEESYSTLGSIASLDPQHPCLFLWTVLGAQRRGDLPEAGRLLERIASPPGPGLLYGRGILLFLQGRTDEAERALQGALEGYADLAHPAGLAACRTAIGNVSLRSGRYQDALESYAVAARILSDLGDRRGAADILSNQGNVLQAKGDGQAALDRYREALVIRESLGDRKGLAVTYQNIGLVLRRRGETAAALESVERSLRINRDLGDVQGEMNNVNTLGLLELDRDADGLAAEDFGRSLEIATRLGDRRAEANALTNLAAIDLKDGRPREALQRHLRALAARRAIGDRSGEAASLNNAGSVQESLGDTGEAERFYEESLAIYRETGERSGEAALLANLGGIRMWRGEQEEGLTLLRQAVALEQLLGDARGEASARERLGRALTEAGEYAASQDALEESLRAQRVLGDRQGAVRSLDALGILQGRLAEFEDAARSLQEALRIVQETGDERAEGDIRNDLGNVRFARGEFAEALREHERSLAIRRSIGDVQGEATSLNNIGAIYQALGEHRQAMSHVRDALDRSLRLPDPRGEALARANLGAVLEESGDLKGASREYRTSIRIREGIGDSRDAALTLISLAESERLAGASEEARRTLEGALTTLHALGDRGGEVLAQSALGDILRSEGRAREAEACYRRALDLAAPSGMREETWRAEAGLAACREVAGDWPEALAAYERAMRGIESVRVRIVSETFKSSFLAERIDPYEKAIQLLWRHPGASQGSDPAGRAFLYAERSRARSLLDLLSEARSDLRRGVDPALLRREAMTIARMEQLERKVRDGISGTPAWGSARQELQDAEGSLEMLRIEIRRSAPRYAEIVYPSPANAEQVRASFLGPDEALLEYTLGEQASYLWILTREAMLWRELPRRSALEPAVRRLLDQIKTRAADLGPEPAYVATAASLGRLLVPADIPAHIRRLLIVPDGILNYLPFEALAPFSTANETRRRLLIETYAISYVPSASVLTFLRGQKAVPPRSGASRILALGDPQVPPAGGKQQIEPLPFAREEVERIGRLFADQDRSVLVGADATEAAIKSADLGGVSFLHFAAHGFVDEEAPGRSGLLLAAGSGDEEDGFLDMNEVFGLRLAARVVVLSACRTGIGGLMHGEGIVGLTRAFLFAGSRSVVVSLWDVNDRSTADLMEAFYTGLIRGASPGLALRQAKLSLLASDRSAGRHPALWAAFVLIGDPGEP